MEQLSYRRILSAGAAGLLLFLAAGCAEPNYAGEGNNFTIRGPVQEVGERSVTILPAEVIDANGQAVEWFHPDDPTQVHDNYKDGSCDITTVGNAQDRSGATESLEDIQEGEWVEIQGQIRESKTSCGKSPMWEDRPVFVSVEELPR